MDRKFSDPSRYENSIDADDSPYGADGGYTSHGNFIPPDAMRELVGLREVAERQAAEIERLRADAERCREALMAIRSHLSGQPSALATALVATCHAALAKRGE